MCNTRLGRRILQVCWIEVLALLTTLPLPAAAQEQVQAIRVGRHAGYARIVLDVAGGTPVAYVTSDPAALHVEAEAPALDPALRAELAALGVRLEGSRSATRLVLDRRAARAWTAFRLGSGSTRIVMDVGADAPGLPEDAEPLLEKPVPETIKTQVSEPAFRIRVSGVTFLGLAADGPDADELLDLSLSVRLGASGAWESAQGAPDAQQVTLRELTESAEGEPALTDSVLQQLVERVAALYGERGRMGTRVDIREADLEPLLAKSGRLVVRIREADEPDRPRTGRRRTQ
jgi:hypothetical protein